MKIVGNTVGTSLPKPDLRQTDPRKGNFVHGKDEIEKTVSDALAQAKESGLFDGKPGADGKDGKDGYTPQKGVDYFDGKDGRNGMDGKDGVDGKTPIKGTDYFTDADKSEMVKSVVAALPKYNGGVV